MKKFISTLNPDIAGDLLDTTLTPVPKGGGLWLPRTLVPFEKEWFNDLHSRSREDTATAVCNKLLCGELPEDVVRKIVATLPPAPLVSLDENNKILELFHGSTMAFKDFGARFMAQATGYLLSTEDGKARCRRPRVLVATSGDTGGAVANAFAGTATPVCVMFPRGRISEFQKAQICRCGPGVAPIEIDGTFDDCQRIAKQGLNNVEGTLSANSINLLRLVAQAVYYFDACRQLGPVDSWARPLTVVVPSGNMGNGTAGVLAMQLGLPIDRLVLATNSNDSVPRLFDSGVWHPRPSVDTISSAMDVGDPSNFARLWALSGAKVEELKKLVHSESANEEATRAAMRHLYVHYNGYIADPHTSVGYAVLSRMQNENNALKQGTNIVLSTAHPYKFNDIVESELSTESQKLVVPPPSNLQPWEFPPATLRLVGDQSAFPSFISSRIVVIVVASEAQKANAEAIAADLVSNFGYERAAAADNEEAQKSTIVIAENNNNNNISSLLDKKNVSLVILDSVSAAPKVGESVAAGKMVLQVASDEVSAHAVAWAIASLLPSS